MVVGTIFISVHCSRCSFAELFLSCVSIAAAGFPMLFLLCRSSNCFYRWPINVLDFLIWFGCLIWERSLFDCCSVSVAPRIASIHDPSMFSLSWTVIFFVLTVLWPIWSRFLFEFGKILISTGFSFGEFLFSNSPGRPCLFSLFFLINPGRFFFGISRSRLARCWIVFVLFSLFPALLLSLLDYL